MISHVNKKNNKHKIMERISFRLIHYVICVLHATTHSCFKEILQCFFKTAKRIMYSGNDFLWIKVARHCAARLASCENSINAEGCLCRSSSAANTAKGPRWCGVWPTSATDRLSKLAASWCDWSGAVGGERSRDTRRRERGDAARLSPGDDDTNGDVGAPLTAV